MGGLDLEYLEVAHLYLFGGVKFLHLLLLLMGLDILTGIFKAVNNGNLWSRKSLFGYARKLLVLIVIITANIIDQVLSLSGTLTFATVLFYIANEALSIIENMAQLGVLVPQQLAEKLKVIETQSEERLTSEVLDEFAGKNVDKELENKKDGAKK
ncbi:holin family protein [Lysinibacillus sp. NPDC058147]|uniref:phage holin family protein n=1 Tax=unclassified Lysinibacillus TaxID=2636778 RepID=UPI0036DAF8DE